MRIKPNLKSIAKSFSFAIKGILYAIKNERNFRIHTVIAFYVMLFSNFYNFSKVEYCILLLTITVVIISELFNSSIEAIIDLVSPEYHILAKIVKDVSAGAVLITAVVSLIIGFTFFIDESAITKMIIFFSNNPISLVALIFSILASILFIFWTSCDEKMKFKE